MPAAIDATTPGRATAQNTAPNASCTTSTFTPPNQAWLVACVEVDCGGTEDPTVTVSGGSLVWTTWAERQGTESMAGGYAAIVAAPVTIGASMAVTLTRTTITTSSGRLSVKVRVITGLDLGGVLLDPITADNEGTGSTQTDQPLTTLIPGADGLLLAAVTEWNALGACSSSDLTYDHAEYASAMDVIDGYEVVTAGVSVAAHVTSVGAGPQWKWAQLVAREIVIGDPAIVYPFGFAQPLG